MIAGLESVRMDATGSRDLKLWFSDGTNYPGQDDIRARQDRLAEALAAVHARLGSDQRMLLEYKFFEPSFYTMDVPDWGTAYIQCVAAGPKAKVVVDTGPEPAGSGLDADWAIEVTGTFWRDWSSSCSFHGEWRDEVVRSLLVLKTLTYGETGAIVAAPTTSLPEQLGGTRNWDYRYCWLRDATITLLAMMRGGYYDEARAWRAWLGRVMAGSPEQVQIT